MIKVSSGELTVLLKDWKERKLWVGCWLKFGENELHKFWSRVEDFDKDGITLAGEHAAVSLPLLEKVEVEYGEPSEAPLTLRSVFSAFGFLLVIRSSSVSAFLFGEKPNPG